MTINGHTIGLVNNRNEAESIMNTILRETNRQAPSLRLDLCFISPDTQTDIASLLEAARQASGITTEYITEIHTVP